MYYWYFCVCTIIYYVTYVCIVFTYMTIYFSIELYYTNDQIYYVVNNVRIYYYTCMHEYNMQHAHAAQLYNMRMSSHVCSYR